MEDLAVSHAKTVVEWALTRALSAIEEETALRQSTRNDLAFIIGEFQMMQSFLNVADEERVRNKVVRTWVRQVRDLAYNVEDCIEYVIHLDPEPDWYCRCLPLPGFLKPGLPLDDAVAEIELLKGRVEQVSTRNSRYNLISDSGSKPVEQAQQQQLLPGAPDGTTTFEMLIKARDTTKMQPRLGDLTKLLITKKPSDDLGVISVWSAGGKAHTTSVIREAYGEPGICASFGCRGWTKLTHPFNPHEFRRSLLIQFHTKPCIQDETCEYVNILERLEKATEGELVKEFMEIMKKERYLVVLENICSMVDWETVRAYLPDGKNGSWVIISAQESEVARLCVGDPWQVFELKHYSAQHSVCVFFLEGSQSGSNAEASSSTVAQNNANEPIDLVGARVSQMKDLRGCIASARVNGFPVVSVWGIAGVGKSALVRKLYHNFKHDDRSNRTFTMFSWVDVSHPFNLRIFSWNLLSEFELDSSQQIGISNPIQQCRKLLEEIACLVVIDGLQSTEEWDLIRHSLVSKRSKSVIVVITTEASIATQCANREEAMFNVQGLEDDEACHLFKEVCKLEPVDPELRKLILKCGGLPKVIVAVADFLAPITVNRMSSAVDLRNRFMHDLETKPEFDNLRGLFDWMDSYFRTCPYYLKPCILYLSIFSQGQSIRRRRVVRRWIAEGYSMDTSNSSAEENGENFFSELLKLSIIQKTSHSITTAGRRMGLCQVNNFFREYIISRRKDEDLVFELDDTSTLTTQRTGRHLVLKESWNRDHKIVFDSIDLSRLRSLTVFGKWEPFFITEAMKALRVLDLENAKGLTDEFLKQMLKLLSRLKFLSLRGATEISHLPSSLSRLRQLETLDVSGTSVTILPPSITKLTKLQYIRAGTAKEPSVPCAHFSWLPSCRRSCPVGGVVVPAGIEKLTALHTFGIVNIGLSGGKVIILKELRKLTQLHKLEVTCVSKQFIKELYFAISGHVHLESLSIWFSKDNGRCLDDILVSDSQQEPQQKTMQKLQSLKIYGLEEKVPAWIKNLPKLTKLELGITMSEQAEVTKFLAEIKELCILRLWVNKGLEDGHDCILNFRVEMNGLELPSYLKVKVLEISCNSELNVSFGSEAMQNLELLTARCHSGSAVKFKELHNLSTGKLKEVQYFGVDNGLKAHMLNQLNQHPRTPALKFEEN